MLSLVKMIPVLIAAIIIGKWYLAEVKKSKARQEAWYKPYFTPPGIIILLSMMLPIIYRIYKG